MVRGGNIKALKKQFLLINTLPAQEQLRQDNWTIYVRHLGLCRILN